MILTDLHACQLIISKLWLLKRWLQEAFHVEYEEIIAPSVNCSALRLFLTKVAVKDLKTSQKGVKTAFSNEELDKDLFMEEAEG